MSDFLSHSAGRVMLFDGAMGTMIQAKGLSPDDFGGHPSVNEILNVTRPDAIGSIHRDYLAAGADIVTTNTFGASSLVLEEHGLAARMREINLAAVRIAREACDVAKKADGRVRYVAGELGPGSKLPSLGHIPFETLAAAYREQADVLIEAGVDLILIGTVQDPLQAKAAASAAREAMRARGVNLPLIISVTIESSGTMLVGTELAAARAAVAPYAPAAFGLNCALGPELMEEHLAELALNSTIPIICQPNAGLPENRGGRAVYSLSPAAFAEQLAAFVRTFGIAMVGGCCGTTPEHIRELAKELISVNREPGTVNRKKEVVDTSVGFAGHGSRVADHGTSVASLYHVVAIDQEPKPFLIAEQTNANGSKKFRTLVEAEDWDGCVAHARAAADGAHALDVCVALPGRDEAAAMHALMPRLVKAVDRPLVIDSTNPAALEAALAHCGGRALINSINVEDGGAKARRIVALARRFGAMLIGLTIDEQGMATTAAKKLEVAKRLVKLAEEGGLTQQDILIDPLTFTLASGDVSTANAAVETLAALTLIKKNLPAVRTVLGVSNISFGLPPTGRRALTSLFLARAVARGLDAAIINPRTLMPVDRIDPDLAAMVERLIDNDTARGNPLTELLHYLGNLVPGDETTEIRDHEARSVREVLRHKLLDGDASGLGALIEALVREMPAQEIVNDVLLAAMREVGVRFGAGKLPLPFVLASAETMRAAVNLLSPHLAKGAAEARGTIVLATVRGDVHDIGKNLVDAILANNGYKVINLGIRIGAAAVMEAARAHNADAIGLSGLLVSSTEIMREDLEEFRHQGLTMPVLCGGAALTEKFTREVLAPAYGAPVYYCKDAFDGLKAMESFRGRETEKERSKES